MSESMTSRTTTSFEPAQARDRALGVGQRGHQVAAVDDERAHIAGVDLVDDRRCRVLTEAAAQIRTAPRPGGRTSIRLRPRALVHLPDPARVEPGPAGLILRSGDDVEGPHQPDGDVRRLGHRDTGAGHRGDPAAGPDSGDEVGQIILFKAGDGGRAGAIERLDRFGQPIDADRPVTDVVPVGAFSQHFPHQERQQGVVGPGLRAEMSASPSRRTRFAAGRRPRAARWSPTAAASGLATG